MTDDKIVSEVLKLKRNHKKMMLSLGSDPNDRKHYFIMTLPISKVIYQKYLRR